MKKKVLVTLLTLCVFASTFFIAQEILKPKYTTSIFEGNFTGSYYRSNYKHDVLVLGDCEVYEDISTVALYRESGLTSYIRGNAQQLAWQSYYMLEDALQHETPQVVVMSVTALRHGDRMSEAYNRMTLDEMQWSSSKLNAIKESMVEGESVWDYIFPLLRYHARWSELTKDDFTYAFKSRPSTNFNGYLMKSGVKPTQPFPDPSPLADYTLPESAMSYLDKIRALCDEKGIQLVLFKSPNLAAPHWFDEWEDQIVAYSKKYNLTYVNCIKLEEAIGMDYSKDTYNAGFNLNVDGAEKVGKYLAKVFTEDLKIKPQYKDDETKVYWNALSKSYDQTKEHQLYELETYGYLKSYGGSPK